MKRVPIDDVVVTKRHRPLRDTTALAESIQSLGLLNPITITESMRLVAGHHRLEACRSLGWGKIPANVVKLDELRAELAEIDENLIRTELDVLERSGHLARRKEIYEALFPETKHGGDRRSEEARSKRNNFDLKSFAEDTSEKTGVSSRTVEQEVQIASGLAAETKRIIRKTPLADSKTELLKLARIKDPERQAEVAQRVVAGEVKTVAQAIRAVARDEKQAEMEAKAAAAREQEAEREEYEEAEEVLDWQLVLGDCDKVLFEMVCEVERDGVIADLEMRPRLAFADPPYNIGIDYGDHHDDRMAPDDYLAWCRRWIGFVAEILDDDGSFWLLVNHEWGWRLCAEAVSAGLHLRQWITWYESFGVNCTKKFNRCSRPLLWFVKDPKRFVFNPEAVSRPSDRQTKYGDKRADPGGKVWDDVWGVNPPIPRLVDNHPDRLPGFPTQLPIELLLAVVGCASEPGDLVIDPFNGSGTTGEAAIRLGRRYVGIEKSPRFHELAALRLSAANGGNSGSAA
jgi:DNA modification methylase